MITKNTTIALAVNDIASANNIQCGDVISPEIFAECEKSCKVCFNLTKSDVQYISANNKICFKIKLPSKYSSLDEASALVMLASAYKQEGEEIDCALNNNFEECSDSKKCQLIRRAKNRRKFNPKEFIESMGNLPIPSAEDPQVVGLVYAKPGLPLACENKIVTSMEVNVPELRASNVRLVLSKYMTNVEKQTLMNAVIARNNSGQPLKVTAIVHYDEFGQVIQLDFVELAP